MEGLHNHALETLEAADMMLALTPNLKLDEVHLIEQVTAEWLTKAFTRDPNARIEEISVVGCHEGMTSRHKWKLRWNEEGQNAGLPTGIFIKATPENGHLRETLSLLHMAELETHVYNDLYENLSDLIPKPYYARAYPGGRFIIILEDLEQREVKTHWMGDTCLIPYARAVAVAQAKIHSRFWNSERFMSDLIWVRPRSTRFGERWLRNSFHGNRKKFLETDLGKGLPEYMRNLINKWDKNCTKVYTYWDSKPPTILHGDSHLGNVLEYKDGSAGYYDWQVVFRGYGYRDLAYFLMSALDQADAKAHEREIFDLYTDTLEQNGVKVDREEAWRDYCLLALERLDAAMTSLTNGGYGHARRAFERQIDTLTYALQEHDVVTLLDRVLETGSI